MASLASQVNVKPVNRRALRRYGELWRALQMVGTAIAEAQKVAAKADTGKPARVVRGRTGRPPPPRS